MEMSIFAVDRSSNINKNIPLGESQRGICAFTALYAFCASIDLSDRGQDVTDLAVCSSGMQEGRQKALQGRKELEGTGRDHGMPEVRHLHSINHSMPPFVCRQFHPGPRLPDLKSVGFG